MSVVVVVFCSSTAVLPAGVTAAGLTAVWRQSTDGELGTDRQWRGCRV